ncbi:tRNA1(Val) (adenine(37)-N6)-methyltransferase [Exiguobacterium antarcticum]|uniref:tRNA1(Val) (Adenine(37)-N6)-methyltransferase n=1 Tax=Exiguobacterium antarcticum TaxID=132920 RepID=A0ABT6R4M1_9BACL|nr:tRNA1(Val) (adenine(37)-N6)-methyltransferase [Exiguobacterium antarcticum]AFS69193.1 methyltransferase small [Exiguobacterium antarcticum B7]MDI3235899.1 tRNA1(Val) (adenine(37)-N6)-methyltransferase [Exiguobacterium antarcticum]
MTELLPDERLDHLLGKEGRIIQSPTVFSYSLDAALLAQFVWVPIKQGQLVDLCAGNGAIPLFLSYRTKGTITGLEIQPRLAGMARRSIQLNDKQDQLKMVEGDVKEAGKLLGYGLYDVVTCNPPYFLAHASSNRNLSEHYTIARHEVLCTLEDCIRSAADLLKQGGKTAFVHRPERLLDIVTLMRQYRIEPKRMQWIYPKQGKEANMLLIEGIKDAKPGLKVLPPFIVYEQDDTYTLQMRKHLDV